MAFEDEGENPDELEMKAGKLVTEFVKAGHRLWKALGQPEHITYPAYSEKSRLAHGDKIVPKKMTHLAPESDIFSLILRDT